MITNALNIALLQTHSTIERIGRSLYWKYRLSQASIGKSVKISFPLAVEGKGRLRIGDGSQMARNINLAIVTNGVINIRKEVSVSESVNIVAGSGALINLMDQSKILAKTIVRNGKSFTLGRNATIASNCMVFPREQGYDGIVQIGAGSNIGDGTTIDTCDDVILGENVAVGPNCIFYTHDHEYTSRLTAAWKGDVKTGKIIVGNGAWIGAGVIILPGITIGPMAVVAAGSVVTKDVSENEVVGGVPARPLKNNV